MKIDIFGTMVSVYSSEVRFVHADLKDQSLETIKKLGRGNYYVRGCSDDYNHPVAEYDLQGTTLFLWQR